MAGANVKLVNPNADVIGQRHAFAVNAAAAQGLAGIVKSNLGPRGTLKMMVSGAGQIKLTKDGKVLLDEMPIQHATAALIARNATAQDVMVGDGTTSIVLLVGAIMHQGQRYVEDGVHPRRVVEGIEAAREVLFDFLEEFKIPVAVDGTAAAGGDGLVLNRELMTAVAATALRTKLYPELADLLTNIVVDAVSTIHTPGEQIDLHMIEIMHMPNKTDLDTRYVNGLVLDHGTRHPNMKKRAENCYILTMNTSLEYEKTMVNSSFFYKSAEERQKMVEAERKFTDDKVRAVIEFKRQICGEGPDTEKSFVIVNQKGIDPVSLDLLQKEGIMAMRRAKKRNMERIPRACGGYMVTSTDDLSADCLGQAELVYEHVIGDDKYTFIEGCGKATSGTVLIRGQNAHTIAQIKDAVRDGLRAVKNVIEDEAVVPGAGAFEAAAHLRLLELKSKVRGRAKLGVQAIADALLTIPKTLANNAGLDATDATFELLDQATTGAVVGLDLETGKCLQPAKLGIWDNVCVKRLFLHLGSMLATQLLLVDEVVRGGTLRAHG